MSLPAMLWALYNAPTTDPTQTLVLIALAEHANDEGLWAWPSVATIARKARCSPRTARRHLAELVEAGLIREQPGAVAPTARADRRPKVYLLELNRMTGCQSVPPSKPRGVTGDRDGVSPVSAEPSLEPPIASTDATTDRARGNGSRRRPDTDRAIEALRASLARKPLDSVGPGCHAAR